MARGVEARWLVHRLLPTEMIRALISRVSTPRCPLRSKRRDAVEPGWKLSFCRSFPEGKVLRKEVIQPQIPLRLPCYDLALLTRFTLGRVLLAVGQRTLGTPCLGGLTGGVYKAREHIHRGVADPRLLAIPASRRRIAASDPNWGRLFEIGSPSRVGNPLYRPL